MAKMLLCRGVHQGQKWDVVDKWVSRVEELIEDEEEEEDEVVFAVADLRTRRTRAVAPSTSPSPTPREHSTPPPTYQTTPSRSPARQTTLNPPIPSSLPTPPRTRESTPSPIPGFNPYITLSMNPTTQHFACIVPSCSTHISREDRTDAGVLLDRIAARGSMSRGRLERYLERLAPLVLCGTHEGKAMGAVRGWLGWIEEMVVGVDEEEEIEEEGDEVEEVGEHSEDEDNDTEVPPENISLPPSPPLSESEPSPRPHAQRKPPTDNCSICYVPLLSQPDPTNSDAPNTAPAITNAVATPAAHNEAKTSTRVALRRGPNARRSSVGWSNAGTDELSHLSLRAVQCE